MKGSLTQHATSFRQPEANPTNIARVLTDRPIGRSPDCMTIRRTASFGQSRLFLRSNYPMKKNWPSCNHSIDSGSGTRWMRNVIAWFAAKIITGREIQVIMGTRENRSLRTICPTKYCDAMPIEWVWPTDDVLITIAMVEAELNWLSLIRRAGRTMQSC